MKAKQFFIPSVVAFTAFLSSAMVLASPTTVVPGKNLDVFVDVDACNSGLTFCTGSGSSGAAADGNDSIVGITIHVKDGKGSPVSGLAESSFSLRSITNQAPGVTPAFVSSNVCSACFAEPQPGVYRLAARPSSNNWGAGTYTVLLKVSSGGGSKQAVVPIDIP